jgi:ABC-type transporter Mla MlaB component
LGDLDGSRTSDGRAPRPPPEPNAIDVVIGGPIGPADVPRLWGLVGALLEGTDVEVVVCDVEALADPDAATVDALARLQLTARRLGRQVRLRHACGELQELLALMGLSDTVPICAELALGSRGKVEEREPAHGVEEEADPADPTG